MKINPKWDPSLALYRYCAPHSRRQGSTRIAHNGGVRCVLSCVCGATHSFCRKWKKPQHAYAWEYEHADCLDVWAEEKAAELGGAALPDAIIADVAR